MDKLLLRPSEAGDLLGVGRSKIYALLASGEIPSVRVGHSVRVPAEALKRWVARQAVGQRREIAARPARDDQW